MKTAPLYKKIAEQIRNLIVETPYASGQKLPSERELSVMFKVRRAAIREALRSLAIMGVLEVRYSEGIFIRNIHYIEIVTNLCDPCLSICRSLEEKDLKGTKKAITRHFENVAGALERLHSAPMKSSFKSPGLEPDSLSIGVVPFEAIELTAKKFNGIARCLKAGDSGPGSLRGDRGG